MLGLLMHANYRISWVILPPSNSLGFRALGLGLGLRVQGLGFRAQRLGFRVGLGASLGSEGSIITPGTRCGTATARGK